jgi:hypothetical protein
MHLAHFLDPALTAEVTLANAALQTLFRLLFLFSLMQQYHSVSLM